MLVGLHVPTNFQMYRQKSEKALLWGGGGELPPCFPPPPLWLRLWGGGGIAPLCPLSYASVIVVVVRIY